MSSRTTCRGCHEPILWRRHEGTGRLAPIDAEPCKEGNIVILDAELYRVLPPGHGSAGAPRHTNHWATCTRPPAKAKKGAR